MSTEPTAEKIAKDLREEAISAMSPEYRYDMTGERYEPGSNSFDLTWEAEDDFETITFTVTVTAVSS